MAFTPAEAHMSQSLQSPSSPADVPSSKASPVLRPQTHLDVTSMTRDSASSPSLWGPIPHCLMPSLLSVSIHCSRRVPGAVGMEDGERSKSSGPGTLSVRWSFQHAPVVMDGTPDKACHWSSRYVMGGASQERRSPKNVWPREAESLAQVHPANTRSWDVSVLEKGAELRGPAISPRCVLRAIRPCGLSGAVPKSRFR